MTIASKPSVRGPSVRQRLWLIAVAVAVPMLLLTVAVVWRLAERERELNRQALTYAAHSIARAADAQLEKFVAIGEALAASPTLEAGDLDAFRQEMERALRGIPGGWGLVTDPGGQILFNTLVPAGQPLPRLSPESSANLDRAFATRKAEIGNLTFGPVVKVPVVAVGLPIVRGNVPAYYLVIVIRAAFFSDLLASRRLPEGWLVGIMDRNGRFIARTLDNDQWVGKPASPGWRAVVTQEGWFEITSVEGDGYFVFNTVSPLSGWAIATAVKKSAFEGPIWQTIVGATLAGLAVTLVAVLLASWAARKITAPIKMLESAAEALRSHGPISVSLTGVPEVDSVLRAFDHASTQLLANETALRKFSRIIEQTASTVVVTDRHGVIEYVNPRFAQTTGYSAQEAIGKRPSILKTGHSSPDDYRQLWQTITHGGVWQGEFHNRRKDGSFYWERAIISPVRDAGGEITHFAAIKDDITEQKRAEAALRDSEARLKKVLEVETVGVMFWDLTTGCMTDANETFFRMMGYSRDQVDARELTWQKLTPPEYVAVSLAEIDKFQATGRIGPYEKEYFRKDGTRQWLVFAGSSLGDNACVEFCVDIADRKAAEDALRDSQARLQSEAGALARLNHASSRLWAIRDLRTGLDEVLAAAIGLLGADMGKVQLLDAGRGVLEIAAHRGFEQDFLDFFREVSANEESSSGRALRTHQRIIIEDVETDPGYQPYREVARAAGYRAAQSSPLIGRDGTPLGMISTYFRSVHRPSEEDLRRFDLYARQATDFIERHRTDEALRLAEEQRQTLQAELFHASRLSEIGRMATAFAHELNQPLAAVVSYIGGCRRILAAGDDVQHRRKVREVMELASAQALRAGEIIRRLREFVGSGERERRIEDAGNLMREACSLAITSATHKGISVRTDIRHSGLVLVDRIQFQQVIINLARNAVEAMESSPRRELAFGLAKTGNSIEVSVSDTGPGLDPKIADRLFSPFSSTKDGGMGIGLSVCREIVEAHEGKIWCEPNPGGGTVFRFTLASVPEHMVA